MNSSLHIGAYVAEEMSMKTKRRSVGERDSGWSHINVGFLQGLHVYAVIVSAPYLNMGGADIHVVVVRMEESQRERRTLFQRMYCHPVCMDYKELRNYSSMKFRTKYYLS
jgi:hypothetical protein